MDRGQTWFVTLIAVALLLVSSNVSSQVAPPNSSPLQLLQVLLVSSGSAASTTHSCLGIPVAGVFSPRVQRPKPAGLG